jgi:hypothetical protein
VWLAKEETKPKQAHKQFTPSVPLFVRQCLTLGEGGLAQRFSWPERNPFLLFKEKENKEKTEKEREICISLLSFFLF